MSNKKLGGNFKPHPELDKLLEEVKKRPPMTLAEQLEQRINFVAASLHLDRQHISRDEWVRIVREAAERMAKRVYDNPPPPRVPGNTD